MKTYIPLGIEQEFALPRHGTCTSSRFSMAGIVLLLLHYVHCTFCCLCLCACMLPNWKLQDQWKKICITLLTSGTGTFSSTPSHFSETLAQSKTTRWKQPHGETFLANDSFDFWPYHLASLCVHFPSADGANWIQVMRKVHEKVSGSNVISQELSISERNVFQSSFVVLTSGK